MISSRTITVLSMSAVLLIGCGKSSSPKSEMAEMLKEYVEIIDDFIEVVEAGESGDDFAVLLKLPPILAKGYAFSVKWDEKMNEVKDDLSPEEFTELMNEYTNLLMKFQKLSLIDNK